MEMTGTKSRQGGNGGPKAPFPAFAALLAGLACLGLLGSCGREGPETGPGAAAGGRPVPAPTLRLEMTEVPVLREFPGVSEASVESILAAKVPGFVREILVEAGDRVRRNDLLVVLDDADVQARIRAMEAARQAAVRQNEAVLARAAYAEANLRRYSKLFEAEAATPDELELVRAEYQALQGQLAAGEAEVVRLQAQLDEARHQLIYVRLSAPADGWITERFADPGTLVNSGQPLLRLVDVPAGLRFTARVDEFFMPSVQPGMAAFVEIPALGFVLPTAVTRVVMEVDPATRTFQVHAALDPPGLKTGVFGRLRLVTGSRPALNVPLRALIRREGLTGVYVLDTERAARLRLVRTGEAWRRLEEPLPGAVPLTWMPAPRAVETGGLAGDGDLHVEILSGLSPGETIVAGRLAEIREGIRIE